MDPALLVRALAVAVVLIGAFASTTACGAAADDGAVTGDDQNLEEDRPCKPLDALVCRPGYNTILLLNCPKNEGRCSVAGCRPREATLCLDGHEPTSSYCDTKSSTRCVAVDAGGADANRD